MRGITVSTLALAAALAIASTAAQARDHLSHANNNPGVDDRGFGNAVNANPGGDMRSDSAGNPAGKPEGFGDPNDGNKTGTPSNDVGVGPGD